ncbi:MAG: pilus assembly PilX family protein [Steroidobacteraceae bacterium]
MRALRSHRSRQAGLVLISSLLLLLIITIIAVSMFRSFGVQEKIAGNFREKERATHAAEEAQEYAEWWLTSSYDTGVTAICNSVIDANTELSSVQVCSNKLPQSVDSASVATVPWKINGAEVGVTYTPPGMVVSATPSAGTYAQPPSFYISYLGTCKDNLNAYCYQIDAVGYGGTDQAVSVVESTYEVSSGVRSPT